jgi:hypothetical protein
MKKVGHLFIGCKMSAIPDISKMDIVNFG